MKGFDCNCYVGNWPFHKVRRNTIDAIRELHEKNDIGGACVSSLEAIFYHDPWEADEMLHEQLKDLPNYHHVITVNPMLPGCLDSIRRAVKLWGIRGVRIFPCYHGYELRDPKMIEFSDLLRELDLTLFITLRMEDERNTYLFHPKPVGLNDIMDYFYLNKGMKVILCGGWNGDMMYLNSRLDPHSEIYWECSAMRGGLYVVDDLHRAGLTDRLLYGSMAPIFVLKSTRLLVETADIPEETKDAILSCKAVRDSGWFA